MIERDLHALISESYLASVEEKLSKYRLSRDNSRQEGDFLSVSRTERRIVERVFEMYQSHSPRLSKKILLPLVESSVRKVVADFDMTTVPELK